MKRLVETLHGEGNVMKRDGYSIGNRPYALRVFRNRAGDSRGGTAAGSLSVEGYVDLTMHEATTLLMTGERLTLQLRDGRRLSFYLQSDSGRIAAAGEIK